MTMIIAIRRGLAADSSRESRLMLKGDDCHFPRALCVTIAKQGQERHTGVVMIRLWKGVG